MYGQKKQKIQKKLLFIFFPSIQKNLINESTISYSKKSPFPLDVGLKWLFRVWIYPPFFEECQVGEFFSRAGIFSNRHFLKKGGYIHTRTSHQNPTLCGKSDFFRDEIVDSSIFLFSFVLIFEKFENSNFWKFKKYFFYFLLFSFCFLNFQISQK